MNTTYLDIETKPLPQEVEQYLKPFAAYDANECLTGNIKALDKIEEKHAAHRAKYNVAKKKYLNDAIDKAALYPPTGQIITIQYAVQDADVVVIHGDEVDMLEQWWEVAADDTHRFINWTGNNSSGNFDWNFLIRRSWKHGVTVPHLDRGCIVNAAKRYMEFAEWNSYLKLERAALELGIPVEDTGKVEGKNFWAFWESDREAALKYCVQDVILLREIWKRMNPWG